MKIKLTAMFVEEAFFACSPFARPHDINSHLLDVIQREMLLRISRDGGKLKFSVGVDYDNRQACMGKSNNIIKPIESHYDCRLMQHCKKRSTTVSTAFVGCRQDFYLDRLLLLLPNALKDIFCVCCRSFWFTFFSV